MFTKFSVSKYKFIFFLSYLLSISFSNAFAVPADINTTPSKQSNIMTQKNVETVQSLLNWMQINLTKESHFQVEDLKPFFASEFVINTNGKIVHATPETYLGYLNDFKNDISSVHYDIEELINGGDYIVVPFIIEIKHVSDATSNQHLRVISIFKFDKDRKIILWQEVFTNMTK